MDLYEIGQDPGGFVRVTLRGYWTLEAIDPLNDELDALIARHAAGPNAAEPLRLLVDGREQDVQSREVIEALRHRAYKRGAGSVRVAVIVAIMLRKLQADRVNPAADRSVFFDEGEARTWLLAG